MQTNAPLSGAGVRSAEVFAPLAGYASLAVPLFLRLLHVRHSSQWSKRIDLSGHAMNNRVLYGLSPKTKVFFGTRGIG